MAIATVPEIRPEIRRMMAVYDRRRGTSPQPSPCEGEGASEGAGDWWRALTSRPKVWGLARWCPPWGWVNVAHFATFEEANRHRLVLERSLRAEGAIAHREDGAPLRAYELSINRLRIYKPGGALNYARRIDKLLCEAQLWAARYGCSVQSRLEGGMLLLTLVELREVG